MLGFWMRIMLRTMRMMIGRGLQQGSLDCGYCGEGRCGKKCKSFQKKKTGVIAPKRFVQRVMKENEAFYSYMHQDGHEFLYFLLNVLIDILEKESKAAKSSPETLPASEKVANGLGRPQANGVHKEPLVTWVHKNFQVKHLIYAGYTKYTKILDLLELEVLMECPYE